MIKKLFSNQAKSVTGAAMILAVASFASRVIGVLRDRLFAHLFGAGDMLDIYYASFRIPDLIYNLIIVGAVSAGFIPVFAALYNKNKEDAWRVTSSVMNILGITLIALCGALAIATPKLAPYLVPGFSGAKLSATIQLTRILFLSPMLLGLSSVVGSVLQSLKSFAVYALSPILYNLGIMFGALVFVPRFGIIGLAYGVILGAFLHLAIQLPTLFTLGFRYSPALLWRDPSVREIALATLPRTLGLAITQINLVVITSIASTLGSGSIAIFTLANNLQYFPVGIIGISFALAAFPTLASLSAAGEKEAMGRELGSTLRQIIFFLLPIMMIFILLRAQIVRSALGTGRFDWTATIATADALAVFALSLLPQCLVPVLVRTFYALHDTWTPFAIGIATEATTIVLSILLKDSLHVTGLALAFSAAMFVQMTLLLIFIRPKLGPFTGPTWIQTAFKLSIATGLMALTIQAVKLPLSNFVDMTKFWGIFLQGAAASVAGLGLYIALCALFQIEELRHVKDSLAKRWLHLRGLEVDVQEIERM